jgi:predicted SnoaL-like aldol condensation-catalyzing enzyme
MSVAQPQTNTEQNKQLMVRWFEEVWNQGRRQTIHDLFAPHAILHDGSSQFKGPDEFCRFYDSLRADFSNFRMMPGACLAEGDLACLHWTAVFHHNASGKDVKVTGTSVVRVANGQFVEAWQNWDQAALAAQLAH